MLRPSSCSLWWAWRDKSIGFKIFISKYIYLYIWTDTTDTTNTTDMRDGKTDDETDRIKLSWQINLFFCVSKLHSAGNLAQISFSSNYNLLLTGASFSPGKGYKRRKENWENNFKFDNLVWKARLTLDLTKNDVYTFSFLNKIDLKSLPIFAAILFSTFPPAD